MSKNFLLFIVRRYLMSSNNSGLIANSMKEGNFSFWKIFTPSLQLASPSFLLGQREMLTRSIVH